MTDKKAMYDEALERRPNWTPAAENREIARLRAERMKLEGGEMTGGMLGADEYVIEPGKGDSKGGGRETVNEGEPLSDAGLRALWLRRVQTKPADFLRAKFAFQDFQHGMSGNLIVPEIIAELFELVEDHQIFP